MMRTWAVVCLIGMWVVSAGRSAEEAGPPKARRLDHSWRRRTGAVRFLHVELVIQHSKIP